MATINKNPTPLEIARRTKGLTRQELAEKSGMPFGSIQACEQRRSSTKNAKAIDILNVSEILGVDIRDLLNDGM